MDANQACDVLVSHLKQSNLNWNLVESPFSLTINLKKSFIKDREGNPRTSGFSKHHDDQKVHELKLLAEENKSLRKAFANITNEKDEVMNVLDSKAKEVENIREYSLGVKSELSKVSEELFKAKLELTEFHSESVNTASEVKRLKSAMVNERMQQTKFLKISETKIKETEKQIETKDKLIETLRAENEMINSENKVFQDKTYQEEDFNHNIIETKSEPILSSISNPDSSSSSFNSRAPSSALTAPPPTTSRGFLPRTVSRLTTNSSTLCSHSPKCILRQPIPPPLPSVTYLVNKDSMYHEKMLQQGGMEYGLTHHDCMTIEYERYGCKDCIWIKMYGETHGYPDVNPWSYRNHI